MSGPSGAGKTTVLEGVLRRSSRPLVKSVSATTRKPRPGETDGEDYHFISAEDFQRRRRRDEFLECFEVFASGQWYGTLRKDVMEGMDSGQWVVLEIDVQGALEVMKRFPEAISIFVSPGGDGELEQRLRGRGTESEDELQVRLQEARRELALAGRYLHTVVNDDLERAIEEIISILDAA